MWLGSTDLRPLPSEYRRSQEVSTSSITGNYLQPDLFCSKGLFLAKVAAYTPSSSPDTLIVESGRPSNLGTGRSTDLGSFWDGVLDFFEVLSAAKSLRVWTGSTRVSGSSQIACEQKGWLKS